MQKQNKFDEKARMLDEHPIIRDIALKFSQTMKKNITIKKSFHALDYGCGSGLIGMHIYSDIDNLVMMDTSHGMLEILHEKINKKNISNIEMINKDIYEYDFNNEQFDLIYMNNVLHHIENISKFTIKIASILKPNGYLCIGDLNSENGTFHDDNSDVKHFGFEEVELNNILKDSGFKNIKYEEYFIVKKPDNIGNLDNYSMFFMHANKSR
ncbi:MAG TPA: class I SAM-dependent methyltransferase [Candidatus Pacebacteria bacterium]|nr:class I SAM-dependent methyltransferase [Candidatus Paceibacterota bacterium]